MGRKGRKRGKGEKEETPEKSESDASKQNPPPTAKQAGPSEQQQKPQASQATRPQQGQSAEVPSQQGAAPPPIWGPRQPQQHQRLPGPQQGGRGRGQQQDTRVQRGPPGLRQQFPPPQQGQPGPQQPYPPQQGPPVFQQQAPMSQQGPQGQRLQLGPPPQQGPQGPRPQQGYQGPRPQQGYQGPRPQQGYQGPRPQQGYQGPRPQQGYQGPRSQQGPQGPRPQQQPQGPRPQQDPQGPMPQQSSAAPQPQTPLQEGQLSRDMEKVSLASTPGKRGDGDSITSQCKLSKGGTVGRPVKVFVNQFSLDLGQLKKVHQYDVAIDPDKPKKVLRFVMEEIRRKRYPNMNPAYDGSKQLYSARPLPQDTFEDTVKIALDDRAKEYKVRVKKVQEIDMSLIKQFYSQIQKNVITDAPQNVLQVVDVVLRHSLAMKQIVVGSSLFSIPTADRTIRLGSGMEMYRGMYQSAILGWKPFLNVDVSNKAFPSALNIIDLIQQLDNRANKNQPLQAWVIDKLKKHLRTLKVEYEIPRNQASKRVYRVNDVVSTAKDYTFQKDNGQRIDIVTYYRAEKGYNIAFPNWPVLWVGSRNSKVHIPVELCTVMPGQPVNRKCDADQTRAMIKECAKNTDCRMNDIDYSVKNARYNSDPVVKEFGFSVSGQFEKVDARILPPPGIKYRQGRESVSRGQWNPKEFMTSGAIRKGWTILNLDSYVKPQEINNLVTLAQRAGRPLGLDMSSYVPARNPPNRVFKADLQKFFMSVKQDNLDLVVVILPNRDNAYAFVKEASEIAVGCLTQCIKSLTVQRKMNEMTMKNILLKLNAKLNGENHVFDRPPEIMRQSCVMVMGADVTHPSPDTVNGFSVAAVTASHDPNAFRYNICWRLQKPGQEIIVDMCNIVKEQLMFFYRYNRGLKPEKLVFFRDGVSTGQFDDVLQSELQAIRRACVSLSPEYRPKITFVVVQKRHHTRFFPVDKRISEDRNMNVPAGTVVDKEVVHPTRQDFYLVSHASIQGVAKPTKYVTLWDDTEFSDDQLEELTYHLCHMFARCTRSVSYPAPTYYAHLAAARGKVYCDAKGVDANNLDREQSQLQIKENIVKGMPMFFV